MATKKKKVSFDPSIKESGDRKPHSGKRYHRRRRQPLVEITKRTMSYFDASSVDFQVLLNNIKRRRDDFQRLYAEDHGLEFAFNAFVNALSPASSSISSTSQQDEEFDVIFARFAENQTRFEAMEKKVQKILKHVAFGLHDMGAQSFFAPVASLSPARTVRAMPSLQSPCRILVEFETAASTI